ncbi:TrbG/VirB9 family P-type conjugative transfer protein [Hydrogenophaga taeniospiralis]|uniref:TrbG/VirB9 family P-type conjugative transfer protein n=1 Tax=Hydrogenophaga taeniospiralis TaxID=65656 RepID=UPI001C3F7B1A|nr:TrbG/VirB9 family P-type conjugative transfer protein [Hydrogenophaga taeniospiralis]
MLTKPSKQSRTDRDRQKMIKNTRFRWLLAALAAFSVTGSGAALAQEVRDVVYRPDQVVRVNTGLGIATQIEISAQEQIKDFGTGFSDGWELVRRDNIFYIRPKNVDVDTNMYIRTNMRSYLLDLRVSATKWRTLEEAKSAGVFYKVRFVYGSDEPDKASSMAAVNAVLSPSPSGLNSQNNYHLNYDYSTVREDSTIVPTRVYDNQQFTYIHLPPMANFPAVFGRHERAGEEFLVNTKSEKNVMVVLGVYPYLVMRLGNDVVGLRRNK